MPMHHNLYHKTLKDLYDRSLTSYQQGCQDFHTWLLPAELAFLEKVNCRVQDLFDFVEDFARHGEPDFETFLLIHGVAKSYLWMEMGGVRSGNHLREEDLPPKTAAIEGIVWLPRITTKALAKLKGELPDNIMYGCGGDRNFLREHNLHAADFLQLVWKFQNSPAEVASFLLGIRGASPAPL